MYETGGDLCPVKSYQLYLMKLHPLQPRLFQQPRRKATPDSPMWYGKAPIGEKALQQMMANISGIYPWLIITLSHKSLSINFLWIRFPCLIFGGFNRKWFHSDCHPMYEMATANERSVKRNHLCPSATQEHSRKTKFWLVLWGALTSLIHFDWLSNTVFSLVHALGGARLYYTVYYTSTVSYLAKRDNSQMPTKPMSSVQCPHLYFRSQLCLNFD